MAADVFRDVGCGVVYLVDIDKADTLAAAKIQCRLLVYF